ncbi:hypothetical protein EZ428_21845 [Pedobacter frigiditerrae]|uniref:Uncharacterized protein n=1 Tax=Pedobacter frigiditerrae TaxID=2530452 RepID=A0A4R0MME3_9SPHI|nr:hypothetical protein [Pedobacter frigiditerrae]TCC87342.1 hypothetical protein EZ428_21845 [Pedobacter frigiditerrae]
MPNFECLYFLENFYLYILEIKRTDLPKDAGAEAIFKWLMIDKETLTITPLSFNSMDAAGEIEERYFEEGYLKFNNSIGTFIEKYNSAQHPLDRRLEWKIATPLSNAIIEMMANESLSHL